MERRRVGGFEVSLLGLGTSRLASMGSGRSKRDARALLDAAQDYGVNFLDTADTYGSTAAERWIGELTAPDPNRWVVATKTGLPTVDLPGPFRLANQPLKKVKQFRGQGFALDAKELRRTIERSLRRLRRERIEVFLLHLPPQSITNDDEIGDILLDARRAGMVAEFGVSSNEVATIHAAHQAWGSVCTETQVNAHSEAGTALGALGGLDVIANHVMVSPEGGGSPAGGQLEGGRTAHARMLRFAAAVPGVKVVLTGTSSVEHLRQNVAAFDDPVTESDLVI